MNFEPTWQQEEILRLIQNAAMNKGPRQIAVKSGQGPGKTASTGIAALWLCFRNVDRLGILTAPTQRQCREVWLNELSRSLEKADPLIRRLVKVTKTRVRIAKRDTWGIQTVTATKAENAQGFHEKNMFWIAEEASGIRKELIEQIQGTLTNEGGIFLQIENPNLRSCSFFDCFNRDRARWATFTMNAEESPIVAKETIENIAATYGRDSDVYRVRVLGEFPLMDPRSVVSSEDLDACTRTSARAAAAQALGERQFGLDLARYGDENVAYRRSGLAIVEQKILPRADPNDLVDAAFLMQTKARWRDGECWYVPDAGGIGQGVLRRFYDARKQVVEFHNHGKAYDGRAFANRITEAWFDIAALAKARKIHIPRDNVLIEQLSTRLYFPTKKGTIALESKPDYKKRLGESPDRADALVLAFSRRHLGKGRIARRQEVGRPAGVVR